MTPSAGKGARKSRQAALEGAESGAGFQGRCPLSRYAFNEEEGELPEWFVQEEKQHRLRQLPVDKKEVEHYRRRWREINARPIKKVAEAKARKKRRVKSGAACCSVPGREWGRVCLTEVPPPPQMLKKLEQTKKKAEAVVNTVDISEREKVAQLRRYKGERVTHKGTRG